MKRNASGLIATLFVLYSVIDLPAATPNPNTALKELRKKYKDVKALECHFREIFEWAMTGETIVREGTLAVTSDDRMRIETPEQLIVSDGKTIQRLNLARSQMMLEATGKTSESSLPRKFLLEFTSNFEAGELTPLSVESQKGYRLDLIPKDKQESLLNGASLWVTEADLVVRRIRLLDLNNNSTTYILTDIRFDKIPPERFNLIDTPEGTEVFDLR
ncbi:MAG: outer membrane lipoprotein carrier protein LolA [Calditrichaeota bacterium]|nr:outer membrane lipoprotein carrier protein LolA [Calditrichota bacterium]